MSGKKKVGELPPPLVIKTKAPPPIGSIPSINAPTLSVVEVSNKKEQQPSKEIPPPSSFTPPPTQAESSTFSSNEMHSPNSESLSPTNGASGPRKSTSNLGATSRLNPSIFCTLKEPFFSLEFFPPRIEEATQNLIKRIETMGKLKPLYIDVTSNPRKRKDALRICADALMFCGVNVMLHIVCAEETVEGVRELLDTAKSKGIRNLMILRGDLQEMLPGDQTVLEKRSQEFLRAADLIRFIRSEYGDWFCLACAAYPEGQDSKDPASYAQDLRALKEKMDAGAEFCVTQLFFDINQYFKFVKDCREMGIHIPIIPGIMPIQLYKVFARTIKYLGTRVPKEILQALEPIKENDAAVREYGINLATKMCKELIAGGAPGVHFFTLNLERTVTTVVEQLSNDGVLIHHKNRDLPWTQSAHEKRANESVRPIFWSNKPKSYVARTQAWDEFPNGRWGDASSPAYGELKGSHYYSSMYGPKSDRLVAWGENPLDVSEIANVFANFVMGTVEYLPWSESGLALETGEIRNALIALNTGGFLTVNSQPRVNAAPSDDPKFGWGPTDGYVYQKAYVEFFVCEEGAKALMKAIERYPSLDMHALNCRGEEMRQSRRAGDEDGPCAVTWGVFPGREILQPTIVDPVSFTAWKDEAFEMWIQAWASIYPEDSPSHSLIWEIHDRFWLVNLVDNDYISGDIFAIFQEEEVKQAGALGLKIKGGL